MLTVDKLIKKMVRLFNKNYERTLSSYKVKCIWEHALNSHEFLIATDPNLHILKLQNLYGFTTS